VKNENFLPFSIRNQHIRSRIWKDDSSNGQRWGDRDSPAILSVKPEPCILLSLAILIYLFLNERLRYSLTSCNENCQRSSMWWTRIPCRLFLYKITRLYKIVMSSYFFLSIYMGRDQITLVQHLSNVTPLNNVLTNTNFIKSTVKLEVYIIFTWLKKKT
jgi:hypothetical protein